MKVKADHWINVNGNWYRPGEEYDNGIPEQPVQQPEDNADKEVQSAKRGRKRKTDE